MAKTQQYREGGWGWFVVLSAFLAEFVTVGTLKAFGVLVTAIKGDLDTDLWVVGSIGALHYGLLCIFTPVASAVARKVGGRCVVTIGGMLYCLGLVLASITHNTAVLATNLVLVAASGAACTLEITRAELAFYFREKFVLASFVMFTGAPLGMMLYGPVTQVLMDTYGWRGAMLLIGGVASNLIWAGLLLRRPKGIYASIPNDDLPCDDNDEGPDVQTSEETPPNRRAVKLCRLFASAIDLDILLSLDFMLVAGTRMFYSIALGGILVYMVPNALSLGRSSKEASFLTTAFGAGNFAGLVLGSLIFHIEVLPCQVTAVLATIVSAVALALTPFISSFIGQMAITCIAGAGVYFVVQVISVMAKDLPFGDNRFVTVLGWLSFLGGVVSSIGDTLSGWLYDATHSFNWTFFLYSAAMVVSGLCLLVDYIRSLYIKRPKANLVC